MNLLGLTPSELSEYHATLSDSHQVRTRLILRDASEAVLSEAVNSQVLIAEGSVAVDADADVSRVLTLKLIDPHRVFYLDPGQPAPNALYMNRVLQAIQETYVPSLARWVSSSVFWGPVTKLNQQDFIIDIEAMGKEYYYLDPNFMWTSRSFPAGGPDVTNLIRWILVQRGELKMDVPALIGKIRRDVTITPMTAGWPLVKTLANSIGYQVFYDGNGYFRMRKIPIESTYTFRTGEGGNVLTDPPQPLDFTAFRNVYEQAWTKTPPEVARLAPTDPASPESLARNGVPRFQVTRSESTVIDTKEEAHAAAGAGLAAASKLGEGAAFDSLPAPHLDEGDIVTLKTAAFEVSFPLRQFSIPLTATDSMSVGYLRRTRMQKPVSS